MKFKTKLLQIILAFILVLHSLVTIANTHQFADSKGEELTKKLRKLKKLIDDTYISSQERYILKENKIVN